MAKRLGLLGVGCEFRPSCSDTRIEKGKLLLHFYRQNGHLVAEITDDGIGRQRSAELKTENQRKHNSTGLKNIEERLAIINKVYQLDYRVHIEDRKNNGTQVSVYLPVIKQAK